MGNTTNCCYDRINENPKNPNQNIKLNISKKVLEELKNEES